MTEADADHQVLVVGSRFGGASSADPRWRRIVGELLRSGRTRPALHRPRRRPGRGARPLCTTVGTVADLPTPTLGAPS